jgi:uncharacterized alkaline shock family protein YloU
MSDTYVTIQAEKGSINISDDVIATIAGTALTDVEGVAGASAPSELLGRRAAAKGIRVSVDGQNVTVEASIYVKQGASITAVAEKVQRAVTSAVESTTGLKCTVNVHVAGVAFNK